MTKQKNTKRALLMSALSLLLCVSMLVGSTFAWFTDSVTSANNIIKSGNLDVELEYAKVVNGQMSSWSPVKGASEIFDPDALWEPGRVEVVYLKVSNLGTLDLKYQLGVNVFDEIAGINAEGNAFKLSEHLVFNVLDVETGVDTFITYTDREAAQLASDGVKGLKDYNGKTTQLLNGETDYVAMIVYMPETVGNEANYKTGTTAPTITLGVNLFATQLMSEEDSFGKDYDKDAWADGMKVYDATDFQAAINNGKNVILMNDIALSEAIVIPEGASVVIDLNEKVLGNANGYAFENKGDVVITGNGTITGLGGIRATGGKVTIENGKFYGSSDWSSGTYQHAVKATNAQVIIKGGDFDATKNGQTNAMLNASEGAVITINGGNFKNVDGALPQFAPYIATYEKNGKIVINDGTFYGGWRFNGETTVTEIKGGDFNITFDGQSFHNASTHKVSVSGGTFAADSKFVTSGQLNANLATGYAIAEHEGLCYVVSENVVSADTLYISTVDQLKAFANAVNGGNSFKNKTVVLLTDIDLNGAVWAPIGVSSSKGFYGTFDGQGHTISNFQLQTSEGNYGAGFFGNLLGGVVIRNVNFDSVSYSNRSNVVGVVAGYLYGSATFENISVTNIDIQSFGKVGGILGMAADPGAHIINMTNCSVEGIIGGGYNVGGLIGLVLQGQTVNLSNCDTDVVFYMNDSNYNKPYIQTADGSWMWVYADTALYAAVAEQYCYYDAQENEFCMGDVEEMYLLAADSAKLINVIKNAPVGQITYIALADGEYSQDINITLDALGGQGGDVVILPVEGATPVISGKITLGYRNQGVGADMYNANVTFEGITFDQAASGVHSLDVQDVKSLTLKDCTIIGDGEYGIGSASGNATGASKIVNCTFENASMQILGNFGTGLVIDGCTLNNSRINVQAGNGVTVQNCEFNNTLTNANVGDSFYAIRSNSTPITVKDCEFNIDSTVTGVATAQAKWYLLANRGTTNWTVENVAVTLTAAALAQTELDITACTSTGVINATNLTVNGVQQ